MTNSEYDTELKAHVVAGIEEIADFVFASEFQRLLEELRRVPLDGRAAFVERVLLSKEELRGRSISIPSGLTIQRSVFADNRPTLFCVSKEIHDAPWHKLTITFDNEGSMAA